MVSPDTLIRRYIDAVPGGSWFRTAQGNTTTHELYWYEHASRSYRWALLRVREDTYATSIGTLQSMTREARAAPVPTRFLPLTQLEDTLSGLLGPARESSAELLAALGGKD